jgi:hypothetical protein
MKIRTKDRLKNRKRQASDGLNRPIRRPARSFELLESRFLLSDATPALKPVVEVSPNGLNFVTLYPKGLNSSQNPVVGPSPVAVDSLSLDDDAFVLASGGGMPAVRVDLLLSPNQQSVNGELLVSSGSGTLLYDVPLTDVDSLRAELPISSGLATASTLNIDLLVIHPLAGKTTVPSFQLAIYWNQDVPPNDPFPQLLPQALTVPSPPPSGVMTPGIPAAWNSTPSFPSLSVTVPLPNFLPTTILSPKSGDGAVPPADPSTGNSVKAGGLPPGPSAGSKNSGASTDLGSPATDPAISSHSAGVSDRPAVVGPLPLSNPTPDGGIFGHANASTTDAEPTVLQTQTIEPLPVAGPRDAPQNLVEVIRRAFGQSLPVVPLPLPLKAPVIPPSEIELSSEPTQSGAILLPPISALARPEVHSRLSDRNNVLTTLEGSSKPRKLIPVGPGIVMGLMVTVGLVFGLVAPQCAARLASLRDEGRAIGRRRWSRLESR